MIIDNYTITKMIIIMLVKKSYPMFRNKSIGDLREIIPFNEEFLLFTINLEKIFNINFYPILEYDSLSSIDRLSEEIYSLCHSNI